jgi:hypothetical protein
VPSSSGAAPASSTLGCISVSGECTDDASGCRKFGRSSVSDLFCSCSAICADVEATPDSEYVLKCDRKRVRDPSAAGPALPVYCKLFSLI